LTKPEFTRKEDKLDQASADLEEVCANLEHRQAELELGMIKMKCRMALLEAEEKTADDATTKRQAVLGVRKKRGAELLGQIKASDVDGEIGMVVGALLFIPVVSVGIMVASMEVLLGWKMICWGVAAVSG
jgi:hypothetical protein